MKFITKLTTVRDALLTVTDKVYHYIADSGAKAPYIVWSEDSEGASIYAGNKMVEQALQGTIHYFTPMEFDSTVDTIQEALTNAGIAFRFNSVQMEIETGLIHYEWVWEIG